MRTWIFLDRLKLDVVYALRGMRRNPGFTSAAVISLALGIGANTAIFTLLNAVMLRSLPVPDPQNLVQVQMIGLHPEPSEWFSYPLVGALAEQRDLFSHLSGFSNTSFVVGRGDSLETLRGAWVSGEFYETLEVRPEAGRLLGPSDDRLGAAPVAVITDALWQRKFARSPQAIGQTLRIEGKPVTIIGVTPAGFTGASIGQDAEITMPVGAFPQLLPYQDYTLDAGSWWLEVLARPKPGISRAQMKARLDVIWKPLSHSVIPAGMTGSRRIVDKTTLDTVPGAAGISDLRRRYREPLLVLLAVTSLLLLIACVNVANLQLARAAARRREIGVRMAIGAGRPRVIRQLLTESLVLSISGAVLGVGLAWLGSRILVSLLQGNAEAIALNVAPDPRVLGFTAAVALLTGVLFGIAPAFQGTAAGPGVALREKLTASRSRLGSIFVAAQLSLTLVLLISAALFVSTLRNLQRVDPGFRTEGVLLVTINGARSGYTGPRGIRLYEESLQKAEGLAGVESASYAMKTPLAGGGTNLPVSVNGRPIGGENPYLNLISRRYFETIGTPVLLGREFTARDGAGASPVAIVNAVFAQRFLPAGRPLGQRVTVGRDKQQFEVIGVVKSSVYETLWKPAPPTIFVPLAQRIRDDLPITLAVRGRGSLAQIASSLRATLQPLAPDSPLKVRSFTEQVESSMLREHVMSTLAATFGVLGLMLAVVGLYGLLAYMVTRRTNEIGVRMALGATQDGMMWMVIRSALKLLGAGIAIGLPAALAASHTISSMLYGLTATDPWVIGVATSILALAGIVAGVPSAWRASRVDPMTALRYE